MAVVAMAAPVPWPLVVEDKHNHLPPFDSAEGSTKCIGASWYGQQALPAAHAPVPLVVEDKHNHRPPPSCRGNVGEVGQVAQNRIIGLLIIGIA